MILTNKMLKIVLLIFCILLLSHIPIVNAISLSSQAPTEINEKDFITKEIKNNLNVEWYSITDDLTVKEYIIAVQNLENHPRKVDLNAVISNLDFDVIDIKNFRAYEWTEFSKLINDYNRVCYPYITINETEIKNDNCTDVLIGNHIEYYLDWKDTNAIQSIDLQNKKINLHHNKLMNLPPLYSEPEEGTENGTKYFKLIFNHPITRLNNGWGSNGKVGFEIDGQEYHPWWSNSWSSRCNINITGIPSFDYKPRVREYFEWNASILSSICTHIDDNSITANSIRPVDQDGLQVLFDIEDRNGNLTNFQGNDTLKVLFNTTETQNITVRIYFNNSNVSSSYYERKILADDFSNFANSQFNWTVRNFTYERCGANDSNLVFNQKILNAYNFSGAYIIGGNKSKTSQFSNCSGGGGGESGNGGLGKALAHSPINGSEDFSINVDINISRLDRTSGDKWSDVGIFIQNDEVLFHSYVIFGFHNGSLVGSYESSLNLTNDGVPNIDKLFNYSPTLSHFENYKMQYDYNSLNITYTLNNSYTNITRNPNLNGGDYIIGFEAVERNPPDQINVTFDNFCYINDFEDCKIFTQKSNFTIIGEEQITGLLSTNVTLKINSTYTNPVEIWNHSGEFISSETIDEFTDQINDILEDCIPDEYGNCTIAFTFHSDTQGILKYSNIKVYYNYTDIDSVWLIIWEGLVDTSNKLWEGFLSFVDDNIWASEEIEVNESFSEITNYTIYANDTLNNTVIYYGNLSVNVTEIINISISNLTLLASDNPYNSTNANLTAYWNIDGGGNVKNITNWYINNNSLTLLNLQFEGGSNSNSTRDYSILNNSGNVSGAIWSNNIGYDGFGAYTFNGTTDYIKVNDTNYLDFSEESNFTIEFRFKLNSIDTRQGLVSKNGNYHIRFFETNQSSAYANKTQFSFINSTNKLNYRLTSSTLNKDIWYHLIVTKNGTSASNIDLYLNGVLDQGSITSGSASSVLTNPLTIGATTTTSSFANATIDDVRIYNKSLSPEQIKFLFNNKSDMLSSQETNIGDVWNIELIVNDGISDSNNISSNYLEILSNANNKPVISNLKLNSSSGKNSTNENLTVKFDVTDIDGENVKNITNWYVNNNSITILNLPFEGGSNSTYTKDYSGFTNGNNSGASFNSTGGYDNFGSYEFGPVMDDYISINDSNDLDFSEDNNFTIEFWFRTREIKLIQGLVGKNENYYLRILNTDLASSLANKTQFMFMNSTNKYNYILSNTKFSANTWYHVAAVKNGTSAQNLNLYVNGVLESKSVTSGGATYSATNPLIIGAVASVINNMNGTMDDIRIYNRALSSEQIKFLFENKSYLLSPQETNVGDVWSVNVTANDGYNDSDSQMSNYLEIISRPWISNVILNASNPNNSTDANLTLYYSVTDPDNDNTKNISVWYLDNNSINIINMPFENNLAKDYSGRGYDGTNNGATWNSIGGYDGFGAYRFGPIMDDYISISDNDNLDFADERNFTIDVRFYINDINTRQTIIGKNGNYFIRILATNEANGNKTQFGFINVTQKLDSVISSTNIQKDKWYHLTAVKNGTTSNNMNIYLDGQYESVTRSSGSATYSLANNLFIGSQTDALNFVNGTIDEFRIWNRSLSNEQIKFLFNNQTNLISSSETNTNDYWYANITISDGTQDSASVSSNAIVIL